MALPGLLLTHHQPKPTRNHKGRGQLIQLIESASQSTDQRGEEIWRGKRRR